MGRHSLGPDRAAILDSRCREVYTRLPSPARLTTVQKVPKSPKPGNQRPPYTTTP